MQAKYQRYGSAEDVRNEVTHEQVCDFLNDLRTAYRTKQREYRKQKDELADIMAQERINTIKHILDRITAHKFGIRHISD